MFLFYFLRDRDRALVGEGQRVRDTQNLMQAPGSQLSVQNAMQDLNPRAVSSGAPLMSVFSISIYISGMQFIAENWTCPFSLQAPKT